jgi:Tol biopolymer transport system component/DNA-binding winged helix-turn-helix (wHTH) protein
LNSDFRLGSWLVRPELNLIQGPEGETSVEPKVMEVLVCLARRPGEVVSKEQLMRAVWPDTFVTDEVLTNAVWELRRVFGDNAKDPHVIQTVFKKGYRLIAPVELHVQNDRQQLATAEDTGRTGIVESRKTWSWAAVVAVVLLGIGWLWMDRERGSMEQTLPKRSVLTSLSGNERSPRFSPDGHYVAFSWNGPGEDNWDIYVQMIDTRELTRRTNGRADDFNPAWSPDGRYIAFGRSDGETGRLILIPQHGGREQVLITAPIIEKSRVWWDRLYFTSGWGPNGEWLVSSVPDKDSVGLVRLSVETRERRQLTRPSEGVWDMEPAVSPDGRSIIFVRELNWTTKDLYLLSLFETGETGGAPERLTFENDQLSSPVWSADGRSILYSYAGHLWQIDVGSTARRKQLMSWGGEPHANPNFDVSHRTNRLVFEQELKDSNIYQIEKSASGKFGPPEKLIESTRVDQGPAYSRDHQKIAFVSERSGFHEIWSCNSDGGDPLKLTNFSGRIGGSPNWSPDGSRIAYDSREEGRSHIYVMSSNAGQVRKLTNDPGSMPRWSRDGKWIYYTVMGALWKIPGDGGVPVFVLAGGTLGMESYDGQFLFFYRDGGIWRTPTKGGKGEFFLDTIDFPSCFDVVEDGIFFLSERTPSGSSVLSFCSFASRSVEPVVELPRPQPGLSVTRDGRSVLFSRSDQEGRDLILLENFYRDGESRDSKRGRRSASATG